MADEFRTFRETELAGYERLVLVAHSLGGLVIQRALLDDQELLQKVKRVFLFATPSAVASSSMAAAFALPSTGGVVT